MSTIPKPTDGDGVLTLEEAWESFRETKSGFDTVRTYQRGVDYFREWCEENGITDTSDLTKTSVEPYNQWMKEQVVTGRWKPRTANTYSGAAREFVHFIEKIDVGAQNSAHENIDRYEVPPAETEEAPTISPERARAITHWLRENRPHTRQTLIFWTLQSTGMRMGTGLKGLDVGDVKVDGDGDPYLHVKHRPADGDGCKKDTHVRKVPITETLYNSLETYVEENRVGAVEHSETYRERRPLFTTEYHGEGKRASKTTIRTDVYQATCPKTTGVTIGLTETCSCDGEPSTSDASSCELSRPPHALRSAKVMQFKDQGHEYEDMEPYLGATADVLRSIYDRASEERKLGRAKKLMD